MTTPDRDTFRAIAIALAPFISGTYDLLNAAAAVQDALPTPALPFVVNGYGQNVYADKPSLWRAVYNDPDVIRAVDDNPNSKIPAIKEARRKFNLGLKDAKEAVEGAWPNQWSAYRY